MIATRANTLVVKTTNLFFSVNMKISKKADSPVLSNKHEDATEFFRTGGELDFV